MLDLAPAHKFGLPLRSPLLPASGFFGYHAKAYGALINGRNFGALVTNPITLRPQRHMATPHPQEVSGGVVLASPPSNRGVKRIINANRAAWQQRKPPLIGHLPGDEPSDLGRTARALHSLDCFAAFELGLPADIDLRDAARLIDAMLYHSELPLLVKIDAHAPLETLAALVELGADALVLDVNPAATAISAAGELVSGRYFGLGVIHPALPRLAGIRRRLPDVPLVAAGGIHTHADVQACLRTGMQAVQLDTVIFTNPAAANRLLAHYISQGD